MPYNPFSHLDLYSNSPPRTCGPSRFSPVCVYDRYNVIGSSTPSLITPVKALEFGTRLNGPSAKENVVDRPPSGTLMIDSPEIGRAAFVQKGGCLLRLAPSAILFSNLTGHLAFQFIFHLRLFIFGPALILLQRRIDAQPILVLIRRRGKPRRTWNLVSTFRRARSKLKCYSLRAGQILMCISLPSKFTMCERILGGRKGSR